MFPPARNQVCSSLLPGRIPEGKPGVQQAARHNAAALQDQLGFGTKRTRKGNWLTCEQAREILAVVDRSKLKEIRDYEILSLLVPGALRKTELAELDLGTTQQRKGRWVLADLEGKGRCIWTVAIPIWVKQGIDVWTAAAGIQQGRLLRPIRKGGKIESESLSDWAVWSVVEQAAKQIGIALVVAAVLKHIGLVVSGYLFRGMRSWGLFAFADFGLALRAAVTFLRLASWAACIWSRQPRVGMAASIVAA